jgi:hypothetical protein
MFTRASPRVPCFEFPAKKMASVGGTSLFLNSTSLIIINSIKPDSEGISCKHVFPKIPLVFLFYQFMP